MRASSQLGWGVECSSLYEPDNGVGSGSDRPGALVGSPSVCVSADSNWLTIESSLGHSLHCPAPGEYTERPTHLLAGRADYWDRPTNQSLLLILGRIVWATGKRMSCFIFHVRLFHLDLHDYNVVDWSWPYIYKDEEVHPTNLVAKTSRTEYSFFTINM